MRARIMDDAIFNCPNIRFWLKAVIQYLPKSVSRAKQINETVTTPKTASIV